MIGQTIEILRHTQTGVDAFNELIMHGQAGLLTLQQTGVSDVSG